MEQLIQEFLCKFSTYLLDKMVMFHVLFYRAASARRYKSSKSSNPSYPLSMKILVLNCQVMTKIMKIY